MSDSRVLHIAVQLFVDAAPIYARVMLTLPQAGDVLRWGCIITRGT